MAQTAFSDRTMSSNRHPELPRPEDRCRGDLERWLGSSTEQPCQRSEAFAEDLPAAAPILVAQPPAGVRAGHRRPQPSWTIAALPFARQR